MTWYCFDKGKTVGLTGSENGEILLDEEHELGARITLEKVDLPGKNYFAITCGIYGWMFHTHFVSSEEALRDFEAMKLELTGIINLIPTVENANDENVSNSFR